MLAPSTAVALFDCAANRAERVWGKNDGAWREVSTLKTGWLESASSVDREQERVERSRPFHRP